MVEVPAAALASPGDPRDGRLPQHRHQRPGPVHLRRRPHGGRAAGPARPVAAGAARPRRRVRTSRPRCSTSRSGSAASRPATPTSPRSSPASASPRCRCRLAAFPPCDARSPRAPSPSVSGSLSSPVPRRQPRPPGAQCSTQADLRAAPRSCQAAVGVNSAGRCLMPWMKFDWSHVGFARRLDVGQHAEQLLEQHPDLAAGEVGAEAEVRAAAAEADVLVRRPCDVEARRDRRRRPRRGWPSCTRARPSRLP